MQEDDDFINITALLRMLTHPCNKELNNYTTRNEKSASGYVSVKI